MKYPFLPALLIFCSSPAPSFAHHPNQVVEIKDNSTTQEDAIMKLRREKIAKLKRLSTKEREAIDFLYKYMPLADVTDYQPQFFLDNVRMSMKAQKEMAWGKNVPELLFRHFVLPIRVNNENLDNSRTVFYNELKERIKGLSMKDAILEVNHWCHEKVTYRPSDARTSAPLATVKSAFGRCGE